MSNNFRDITMRQQYDAAVKAYNVKHRDLFLPSGDRKRAGNYGSSFATFFWQGFDNYTFGQGWDAASRRMIGYAVWRAGRDIAKSI